MYVLSVICVPKMSVKLAHRLENPWLLRFVVVVEYLDSISDCSVSLLFVIVAL